MNVSHCHEGTVVIIKIVKQNELGGISFVKDLNCR